MHRQNPTLQVVQKAVDVIIRLQEQRIEESLENMITDGDSDQEGGIIWKATGHSHLSYFEPSAVSFIPRALSLWREPRSKFFRDEDLLKAIKKAMLFVDRNLPASGLISMVYCNFSSPADAGFALFGYAPTLKNLRSDQEFLAADVLDAYAALVWRLGKGLINGGVHTPNHRWSNTQGLGWLWHLFNDQAARTQAEEWLAEGIDVTCDGEYLERSLNYSNHSNRSLLSAAYTLDLPHLIEPARQNMLSLPYLMHDDGYLETGLSRRNDAGLPVRVDRFLESAYLLHALEPSPQTSMLVHRCSSELLKDGEDDASYLIPATADMLPWLQLFPADQLKWPEPATWPGAFIKVFGDPEQEQARRKLDARVALPYRKSIQSFSTHATHGAPFVRIRNNRLSATIATYSDALMMARFGQAQLLGIYCNLSYFGQGPVQASRIATGAHQWTLACPELGAEFMGPLGRPATALDFDYENRPVCNRNEVLWQCHIHLDGNEFTIRVNCSGAREESGSEMPILAQMIFEFPLAGDIMGTGLISANKIPNPGRPGYLPALPDNDAILEAGELEYKMGADRISVTGGTSQHKLPTMLGEQFSSSRRRARINLVFPGEHVMRVRFHSAGK